MKKNFIASLDMKQFKHDFRSGSTYVQLAEKHNIPLGKVSEVIMVLLEDMANKMKAQVHYTDCDFTPAHLEEIKGDAISLFRDGVISEYDLVDKYKVDPFTAYSLRSVARKAEFIRHRLSFREQLNLIKTTK